MTAAEAKLESSWRSLPPLIRVKIERATEWDENSEIWISYNKKYRQISFIELCRIYEKEF